MGKGVCLLLGQRHLGAYLFSEKKTLPKKQCVTIGMEKNSLQKYVLFFSKFLCVSFTLVVFLG